MPQIPAAVFWIAAAGMELSWVYAWAAFSMDAAFKRPYPLPEAAAIFLLASLLTAVIQGRGWRIIQILLVHAFGLIFFIFRSVHELWYRPEAFWGLAWLGDFFSRSRDPHAWLTLLALWAWTIVFWIVGVRYSWRPKSYPEICIRFDKGLTWLFTLLLVKLLIRTQMGIPSAEAVSEGQIFPFFVFGLLAVALARNRSGSQKDFMTGYRGLGLMISFSAAVLLCGTGLVLLFLPYLRAASETGYEILITSGKFLGPILLKILYFIFGYKPHPSAVPEIPPVKSPVEILPKETPSEWTELFFKILIWSFWVLLSVVLVFLAGLGALYLWRWLFSRTQKTKRGQMGQGRLMRWLGSWIVYLQTVIKKRFGRRKGPEAIRLYRALLRWGQRSGLPNRKSETPLEYGRRLKQPFQSETAEVDRIISAFNLHVYGKGLCDEQDTSDARQALKRLQRPRLWPKRLKSWFLSGG